MSEETIVLAPGAGRAYVYGALRGVFKADGAETDDRYCVSEWTVEAGGPSPGAHKHDDNVELFLVTEGTLTFRIGDDWIESPRGTFLRIPAGVVHDFENRTPESASAFNVFMPGGFERRLVGWQRG